MFGITGKYEHVTVLFLTMVVLSSAMVPATMLKVANAEEILVVGADEAKITARDNLGNEYQAWYLKNPNCLSGWEFKARKITSSGFITDQNFCVSGPCDSITFPQGLHIIRNNNDNRWELSFVDQAGREWRALYGGGGTFIQTFGHDLGTNIRVDQHNDSAVAHQIIYHHAFPICPAAIEQ